MLRLHPASTQRATRSRTTGIVTLYTDIITLYTDIITLYTDIITQTRDTIRVSGSADLLSAATANLRVSDRSELQNMTVNKIEKYFASPLRLCVRFI